MMEKTASIAPAPDSSVPAALDKECLPLRAEQGAPEPAGKTIHQTAGGKFMHVFNHYLIGGVANFMISMGITYFLNPRPETKQAKDKIEEGVGRLFGGINPETQAKVRAGARSGLEVVYMFAAGIITTLIMTPLVTNSEKLAHKFNQLVGKDKDVLPDYMKQRNKPETQEERIEQELCKRVNYKQSAGDLWKARIATMAVIWLGDQGNEYITRKLEAANKPSMDTTYWQGGFRLADKLPKRFTQRLGSFLDSHGAGMDKIRENAREHQERIDKAATRHAEASGNGMPGDGQIAVAESFRIAAKEATYMVPLTIMIDKLTKHFHESRVKKQQAKALEAIKEQGLVPQGYGLHVSKEGRVTLMPKEEQSVKVAVPQETAPSQQNWTDKAPPRRTEGPAESFAQAVSNSRNDSMQPAMGAI